MKRRYRHSPRTRLRNPPLRRTHHLKTRHTIRLHGQPLTEEAQQILLTTAGEDTLQATLSATATPLTTASQTQQQTNKHYQKLIQSILTKKQATQDRLQKAMKRRIASIFSPNFPGKVEWKPLAKDELPKSARAEMKAPKGSSLQVKYTTSIDESGTTHITFDDKSTDLLKAHRIDPTTLTQPEVAKEHHFSPTARFLENPHLPESCLHISPADQPTQETLTKSSQDLQARFQTAGVKLRSIQARLDSLLNDPDRSLKSLKKN